MFLARNWTVERSISPLAPYSRMVRCSPTTRATTFTTGWSCPLWSGAKRRGSGTWDTGRGCSCPVFSSTKTMVPGWAGVAVIGQGPILLRGRWRCEHPIQHGEPLREHGPVFGLVGGALAELVERQRLREVLGAAGAGVAGGRQAVLPGGGVPALPAGVVLPVAPGAAGEDVAGLVDERRVAGVLGLLVDRGVDVHHAAGARRHVRAEPGRVVDLLPVGVGRVALAVHVHLLDELSRRVRQRGQALHHLVQRVHRAVVRLHRLGEIDRD